LGQQRIQPVSGAARLLAALVAPLPAAAQSTVRAYWTRQWALIDPRVEPRGFAVEADGRVAVTVHQLVRDLAGTVLKEATVEHVYAFEDGLIKSMEIRS
jgi:hypothetical protein